MTRLTPRVRWVRIVKAHPLPATRRTLRGTLLCLADLMTPAGELCRWWDEIEEATGLPRRTVERHLSWAVDLGLLEHRTRGGHGRRGEYLAADPTASAGDGCPPREADNFGELSASHSRTTPASCPPRGGGVNKDDASDSERVAVDTTTGQQNSTADTSPAVPVESGSDEEEMPVEPSPPVVIADADDEEPEPEVRGGPVEDADALAGRLLELVRDDRPGQTYVCRQLGDGWRLALLRDLPDARQCRCPVCGAGLLVTDPECGSCRRAGKPSHEPGDRFVFAPPTLETVADRVLREHVAASESPPSRPIRAELLRHAVALLGGTHEHESCRGITYTPAAVAAALRRIREKNLSPGWLPKLTAERRNAADPAEPWQIGSSSDARPWELTA